jgi:hypothetical protein
MNTQLIQPFNLRCRRKSPRVRKPKITLSLAARQSSQVASGTKLFASASGSVARIGRPTGKIYFQEIDFAVHPAGWSLNLTAFYGDPEWSILTTQLESLIE